MKKFPCKHTDEERKEILRHYVDNGNRVSITAKKYEIPVQTIYNWLRAKWGKLYVHDYVINRRTDMAITGVQQIIQAKVEHITTQYEFDEKANIILSLIEDRVIELIPKTNSIKELSGMYKVVADIKIKLTDPNSDPGKLNDNQLMIVNLIQKQLNVSPIQIKDLLKEQK